MFGKLALVAALALPLAGFGMMATPAEAKTNVQIYLGIPYYSYRPGYDYRYYPGRGWYKPNANRRVTCNRGIRIVRNNGYRNVRVVECNGPRYTYRASRNGRNFTLSLNARNGRLMRL